MKKRSLRKIIGILLSFVMVVCFVISPMAAQIPTDSDIMPLWESINYAEVNIAFGDGICNPVGTANKQSTATSIEGTLTLYEEIDGSWEYIDEWYKSVTRGTLAVSGEVEATSGVRYKAVFEVTAYTGSVPETTVMESIRTCP